MFNIMFNLENGLIYMIKKIDFYNIIIYNYNIIVNNQKHEYIMSS